MSVQARYRGGLQSVGEPLLVTASPIEEIERLDAFIQLSGLTQDDLIATPIVTTPIPLYPPDYDQPGCFGEGPGGARRRWAGVKPDAMWHPLMWLPPRVALRYMVATLNPDVEGGEELVVESDDAWAVRVCMEVAAVGLYNSDTGEWLDVLSMVGIDTDKQLDLDRVQRWLDGAPDTDLDGIDLTPLLDDAEDIDWAFSEANLWMESLQMMMWATHSESLLESARMLHAGCTRGVSPDDDPDAFDVLAPEDGVLVPIDINRALNSAESIAMFGWSSFGGIAPEERLWWDWIIGELREGPIDSPEDLASGPLAEILDHLSSIRDDLVPALEDAAAAIGEPTS